MKKPKMKLIHGTIGITEKEFNKWYRSVMESSIKVYSQNADYNSAAYFTENKMTNPKAMRYEALVIDIKEVIK